MRNPVAVLENLQSKSKKVDYKFKRLYRNLYNLNFYLLAYNNLYANEGNMTKGIDGMTIDGMGLVRINKIIDSLKDHSYSPKPAKRKYIEKKNGKKRPLGISSFDDKLVQEIVRMILESIYEGTFKNTSHGFRPQKSCHTALKSIKLGYTGVKWFIEGDISSYFDTIDHHILINILRKRIHDEYFISLIWKFLKAGYIDDWKYNNTYSGTPQGSVTSPIISNIYLNELDSFMEEYKVNFDIGKARKINPEYNRLNARTMYIKKKNSVNWESKSDEEKVTASREVKRLLKLKLNIPKTNPMDSTYKRLLYTRYADDFLIGLIGSKEDAQKVKGDISEFLYSKLRLQMSDEKTLITNSREKARFLGFDITVDRSTLPNRDKNGVVGRHFLNKVKLFLPRDRWQKKLTEYEVLKINKGKTGKEIWEPAPRPYLQDEEDIEILKRYNGEIIGLYNYYKIANNVSMLHRFKYVMEYSMYKTFAAKYKSTVRKINRKYSINGNFRVRYQTKQGSKVLQFYNSGFKRMDFATKDAEVDMVPLHTKYAGRKSLIARLLTQKCEWCGKTNVDVNVHHVRKLKSLNGSRKWEQLMLSKKRKTLVLCLECHDNLHNGLLD